MGRGRKHLLRTILLGNVFQEVDNTSRVAVFIIVPSDQLDEVGVQLDTCGGIKDGGIGAADKVCGHNGVGGEAENALVGRLGGLLDGGDDLLVVSGLLEADDEIDNRDIKSGDTEGQATAQRVKMGALVEQDGDVRELSVQ